MSRVGQVTRTTSETGVSVSIDLEGSGEVSVDTGVPFFDHMLSQFGTHGRFDVHIDARGDLDVDAHHTVEDVGIALGQAVRAAVGDGRGIARYASLHVAMDDALVLAAIDVGGRSFLHYGLPTQRVMLGTFPSDLSEEFFRAFVTHAAVTLHLVSEHGRNTHHIIEAAFKGVGIMLRAATQVVRDDIPSTKGRL